MLMTSSDLPYQTKTHSTLQSSHAYLQVLGTFLKATNAETKILVPA